MDVNLHFLKAVCDLKNVFTFGGWCYYAFTVTVSYVITRERWFRVYYLHAENFLAFDQIQLDAYRAVVWRRFEATFKLRPVIPIFERNEMTEIKITICVGESLLWRSFMAGHNATFFFFLLSSHFDFLLRSRLSLLFPTKVQPLPFFFIQNFKTDSPIFVWDLLVFFFFFFFELAPYLLACVYIQYLFDHASGST